MRYSLVLAAALLAACGNGATGNDSGADSGTDAGTDATPQDGGSDSGLPPSAPGVTQFHYDIARTGWYRNETQLTPAALMGGSFHRDQGFAPMLDDAVYAQPLYLPGLSIMGGMHDVLFVATQNNSVYALDALTGATLWTVNLGSPVPLGMQPCGNISPHTGILGTPAIDPASNTLYAVSYSASTGAMVFSINALDVLTGQQRTGYPQPINPPMSGTSSWTARTQQQRAATLLVDGKLYVPFGGLYGDCGTYHGWIVQIDVANPTMQTAWATGGNLSGIWGPSGPASDGMGHVFAATGNGANASSMGDYVVRLQGAASGVTFSGMATDYFQPSNWQSLNSGDVDLGTINPIVLPDHAGSSTPHLLFTGGKSGVAHLINRDDLGGTAGGDGISGEGVYSDQIFSGGAWGGTATFANGTDTYVFIAGQGTRPSPCTGSGGIAALHLTLMGGASAFELAWCSASSTNPSAPTISSNGTADAVLWMVDRTSHVLHAYSVPDGMSVYTATAPDIAASARQWTPPVVVDGRVYVTGTNTVTLYRLM